MHILGKIKSYIGEGMKNYFWKVTEHLSNLAVLAVMSLVWFIAYLIMFSWWLGFELFFILIFFYNLKEYWKDIHIPIMQELEQDKIRYKNALIEQKRKEEERKLHESLPHVKLAKLYQKNPSRVIEIVNNITQEMKKEINKQIFLHEPLEPISSCVQSIWIRNDERVKLANKDLEEVKNYNPDTFLTIETGEKLEPLKNILNFFDNLLSQQTYKGVPVSPFFNALEEVGFSIDNFKNIKEKILLHEKEYKDAIPYLDTEVRIHTTGFVGENRVQKELEMYDGLWKVYPNVRIEVNGDSAESDFIVLSKKGIFVLEVKNFAQTGNYSLRITKDGQWLKIFANGKTEPISDIASQVNRHIALKQRMFVQNISNPDIPIVLKPIIIFANDTIRIENETDLPIMRISQIYHHIMKQPDVLNKEEIDELAHILEANLLAPKKYEYQHYTNFVENGEIILNHGYLLQDYKRIISKYLNKAEDALLLELNKQNK